MTKANDFSLHARVSCWGHKKYKRKRLLSFTSVAARHFDFWPVKKSTWRSSKTLYHLI
jgi:hypothetical protein